jgi:hypothetical protein
MTFSYLEMYVSQGALKMQAISLSKQGNVKDDSRIGRYHPSTDIVSRKGAKAQSFFSLRFSRLCVRKGL